MGRPHGKWLEREMLSYLTLCKVPGFELEPWILVPVLAISVISLAQRMTWQSLAPRHASVQEELGFPEIIPARQVRIRS